MRSSRVGHSGLEVSRIGLGTMGWAEVTDEHEARELLRRFLDAGGTLVDTAASYADGAAEAMLGELLAGQVRREELVIATKAGIGGRHRTRDTSRGALLDTLDASLRRLRTDRVDLWQVHLWDDATPLAETVDALQSAVRSGKARYVGVSNYRGWQTVWAQQLAGAQVPLVSNQVEYSLLNRAVEGETAEAAAAMGMGLIAWSPLARGVLTGKYRYGVPGDSRGASAPWEAFVAPYLAESCVPVIEAVAKAADGLELSMTDVALAWLLGRPQVVSAVVGARTADQLTALLGAAEVELPAAIAAALDDVSEGMM